MTDIIKKLIVAPGTVSGREGAVADKIKKLISEYTDECAKDALGNLIAVKRSGNPNAKKIMLCAHMDEIGFITTFIEKNGSIRFGTVGGINFVAAAYSTVVFENGTEGILVPESGTRADSLTFDKFYVDIGASSDKEAAKKVKIGDCFSVKAEYVKLCGKKIAGRPFDDRVGCAMLVEIAKRIAKSEETPDYDVYYVFSTQEEVGCRGSKTAAFAIQPDVAIAFDVTGTGDTIGAKPMACKVGDGAAIKIKDSSVICDPELVKALGEIASRNKIKCQYEILLAGGTDTSAIQMAGTGCSAGCLSVPTRYIHSNHELLDLGDVEAGVELAKAYILGK